MNKKYAMIAIVLLGMGFAFAQTQPTQIGTALDDIRIFFCAIMPALMLVAFLLAAIVYAAGQMASADQRARFHGWATSLLIGGITCGVIVVLAPFIIGLFMPNASVTTCY
jgi:hypothetical protein